MNTSMIGLALLSPVLIAYEPGPVEQGGRIQGVVMLNGAPPAVPEARIPDKLDVKDAEFCRSNSPLVTPYYTVGKDGGLADVVVWIDGIEAGLPPVKAEGAVINENCRFFPHVQSMDVGAKVLIENRDPILHTTHATLEERHATVFNVGMPRKGQKSKKKLRREGLMRVGCDSGHPWMRAWIYTFKHPYHTVTDADGRFTLSDVPPGRYTVRMWHEAAGTTAQEVAVEADGTVMTTTTFSVKPIPNGHGG